MMKYTRCLRQLLSLTSICLTFISVARFAQAAERVVAGMDSIITRFELSDSPLGGIGGATMADAVQKLQEVTGIPVCLEEIEYDGERDGLTLSTALQKLRELQARNELSESDRARLERYEELMHEVKDPDHHVVFMNVRTFKISESHVTLRALLDHLIELDPDYTWQNDGNLTTPLIVVQPKAKSALDWTVPSICKSKESLRQLYGAGGSLTELLNQHKISLMWVWIGRTTYPQQPNQEELPTTSLDLCHESLTARDVLMLTVKALGPKFYWTLSGIKEMRFLQFESLRSSTNE